MSNELYVREVEARELQAQALMSIAQSLKNITLCSSDGKRAALFVLTKEVSTENENA